VYALLRDLRLAVRSLRRTPFLTAAALISIALAIAAATAVFSVVDAALLRPPPFAESDRLAMLYVTRRAPTRGETRERWSWPQIGLLRQWSSSFDAIGSFTSAVLTLSDDAPEPVDAELVSSSYLDVLGVRPIFGRAFNAAADSGAGARPVALVSYELWQRRFGGDRSLIGRTISLNNVVLTVIGILPRGFAGLSGRARLWIPATMAPLLTYEEYLTTNQSFISVVGKLRPGVALEGASEELATLGRRIQRVAPSESSSVPGETRAATARSLSEARIDPSTLRPMLLLALAATCLLALSCANVANLLLGRAASRRREMAIRLAAGATRGRIVKQLLVEACVLTTAGGVAGVGAAAAIATHLPLPSSLHSGRNFYGALGEFATPQVNLRVLAFSVALCAITTLLFGLVPALRAADVDLTTALKDGAPGGGRRDGSSHWLGGRLRVDGRRAIVAMEVALATLLLTVSGLLAASYRRLQSAPLGFDRTHLLTFLLRPPDVVYPPPKAAILYDRVLAEIELIPGVEAATVDGCAPVGTGCANSTLFVMGRQAPRPDQAPPVLRHYVGPHHFLTLRVPLITGRVFDAHDRAGSERVAIINETAARRFWPNENPLGARVWFGGGSNFDRPDSSAVIVGIVGDVAYQPLDEHPVQPDFYTPYTQFTYASRTVLVRTTGDPSAVVPMVREAVRRADATLALFDVRTMEQRASESWARREYQTFLLGAFAAVALVLAATGIFAVVAHFVAERQREIGIRAALGARPIQVLATVAARAAVPAAAGLAAGGGLAVAASRMVAAVLYDTSPLDPLVFGAVLSGLAIVIATATLLPAVRALRIEPLEALRES
jgi:putative ABC transport system permease protein